MRSASEPIHNGRSLCTLEQLENRTMLAVTAIPDPTPTTSEPVTGTIARRTPRAPVAAEAPRTIYVSPYSQNFAILDASFGAGTPSGFTQGFWTGNSVWTPKGNGVVDTSEAQIKSIADLVKNGGKVPYNDRYVQPHSPTVIDLEHKELNAKGPEFIAQLLATFRKYAPDEQIGLFGYDVGFGGINRDRIINPSANDKALIAKATTDNAQVIQHLSFINLSVYLIQEKDVDRDLKCFEAMATHYRKLYPDKPLVAFAWGLYHPSWSGPNAYIPDNVLQRYINCLRQNFDGIMIWGSHEHNANLTRLLKDPANQTRLSSSQTASSTPTAPLSAGVIFGSNTITDDVLGQAQAA